MRKETKKKEKPLGHYFSFVRRQHVWAKRRHSKNRALIFFLWIYEIFFYRRMRSSSNGFVPRFGVNIVGCLWFVFGDWACAAIEKPYGENGFVGLLLWIRAFKFESNASLIDVGGADFKLYCSCIWSLTTGTWFVSQIFDVKFSFVYIFWLVVVLFVFVIKDDGVKEGFIVDKGIGLIWFVFVESIRDNLLSSLVVDTGSGSSRTKTIYRN